MIRLIRFSCLMTIILLLTVAVLTGCTPFTTAVAPRVADAVKRYCAEPLSERQLIRGQVNGMLVEGTSIKVTCPGDPE